MKMNSYGWVFLIIVIMAVVAWVGGEAGFQVEGMPILEGDVEYDQVLGIPTYYGALPFIANLAVGKIEGMPFVFCVIFDCIPFFMAWIVYRQIRGQD